MDPFNYSILSVMPEKGCHTLTGKEAAKILMVMLMVEGNDKSQRVHKKSKSFITHLVWKLEC